MSRCLSYIAICLYQLFQTAATQNKAVTVLYYALHHWNDDSTNGNIDCGDIQCDWLKSSNMTKLKLKFEDSVRRRNGTTLALYNTHSLLEKFRAYHPINCDWQTDLTMASSEESYIRFGGHFNRMFQNFDGNSTTHPHSTIQRIFNEATMKNGILGQSLINEIRSNVTTEDKNIKKYNFPSQIKGASYVASECHRRDGANANRDNIVAQLRHAGLRVDGLGRCMKSSPSNGTSLSHFPNNSTLNAINKQIVIGKFLFNLALENSLESGYVTEKPFDALMSGTVPVYLGDKIHLKALIPHQKSVIFIADYDKNYTKLAEYLNYLSYNETAYSEYRVWRKTFSNEKNIRNNALLNTSWYCNVCKWTYDNRKLKKNKKMAHCKV